MDSETGHSNIKLKYLNDFDVYLIDYNGTITFDKGLANMEIIENEFRELSINKACLKVIFDLTNTVWENGVTHDSLLKVARKLFDPHNFKIEEGSLTY